VFFRAPTVHAATDMLATSMRGGGWADVVDFASRNLFIVLLVAIFFLTHRFDDHRRVKAAVRYVPAEVFWPALLLLWVVAITVSQGSSAKFIYFDF
jgi:hypothetical protein